MERDRQGAPELLWNVWELVGDIGSKYWRRTMADFKALPALISVPKAAQILGLSRASAYRFAASGDLPTLRLGGRVFVVTSRLAAFINGDGEAA
jgi:predicted DNA-binding transcriptional regulator AlpA